MEQIELLESYGVTVNKSADGNTYSYYEGGIAPASEELDLPGEGYYYVFSKQNDDSFNLIQKNYSTVSKSNLEKALANIGSNKGLISINGDNYHR